MAVGRQAQVSFVIAWDVICGWQIEGNFARSALDLLVDVMARAGVPGRGVSLVVILIRSGLLICKHPLSGVHSARPEVASADGFRRILINSQTGAAEFDDLTLLYVLLKDLTVIYFDTFNSSFSHLLLVNSLRPSSVVPICRLPT